MRVRNTALDGPHTGGKCVPGNELGKEKENLENITLILELNIMSRMIR